MKFEERFEKKFKETIEKNNLFSKKDKILLAISGGKDSLVNAYLLKKFGYNFDAIHIDLKIGKYSEKCREACEKICEENNIPLFVYDLKEEMGSSMCYVRSAVQSNFNGISNCSVCGVIKKWILNRESRKLKAKAIVTGHNIDDEAQTFLMNILKGSPELSSNTGPKSKNISNKKFIPRVKPLYYHQEEDILKYSKLKKLPTIYEKCPCSGNSYRVQIRNFIEKRFEKEKKNLIKSFEKISKDIPKKENSSIKYCENCGEPSRKNICKRCELVGSTFK